MDKKYYIITGAPSTGKSSVVKELIKRGYVCHDEIARQVIKENQDKNNDLVPWKNMLAFSDEVFRRMKILLKTIENSENKICFLDRSMIDLIGYIELSNQEAPAIYAQTALRSPYAKDVFIMPFWEDIFANDEQRLESVEEAKNIDKSLRKAYSELGYNLIDVPKGTVEERVDFILSLVHS